MNTVHSKFGGSVAARVLNCPGSVNLVDRVPAYLHKPSNYANRGSAMHEAMTLLLAEDACVEKVAGKTFGDYTITSEDVEDFLRPVCDYVNALLDAPGAEFFLEKRVVFPTVDAWGTADLLVRIGRTIHVVDTKFGVGVPVLALTPDGDEDVLNSQLMFYASAARASLPGFFIGVERIILTILQPVVATDLAAEMISTTEVSNAELDEFITVYSAVCAEASSDAPRLERGAWCRFCPARVVCPLHSQPLLDLAQLTVSTEFAAPKEAYLQALAAGLDLVDAIKDIRTALHDQAKRALEQGDNVPGYALSAGRAERRWRDEIVAQVALLSLGFDHDDIIEAEMMRTPKQLELRAKARGLKIPPELIISNRSGVSLVRSENVRVPVLGRDELARTFSEALEAFQGGRQL